MIRGSLLVQRRVVEETQMVGVDPPPPESLGSRLNVMKSGLPDDYNT
jgi:hypothetical protein